MKKLFIFFLYSALVIFSGLSQNREDNIDSIRLKTIVDLLSQNLVYPQEKIYLQTDRPYYVSGEKIFFRTFLLRASDHTPAYMSRYVYVELVSPVDTVVLRQQIRISDNKMFHGALVLPDVLPEGNYSIRAYTRYMENVGESKFYGRPVFIADPNAAQMEVETDFEFLGERQVGVRLRFKDIKTGNAHYPENIELRLNRNKEKIITKPDNEGRVSAKFNLKNNETQRTLLVECKAGMHSFGKYIRIPYNESLPEINFYPEGGNLVAGEINRVAFKVLLPSGQPATIKGTVFDSKNEPQTTFTTRHEGMGDFMLEAKPGESYYARYKVDGQNIKVNLPKVKNDAYSLQIKQENDSISVKVLNPQTMPEEPFYLLVYNCGIPTYFDQWDFSRNEKKWSKSKLQSGVTRFLLLTADLHPVSERAVFNNLQDNIGVETRTRKNTYHPREHVSMDIRLQHVPDTIPSSFAISITDDKDVKIDTTTHILSEILLVSELEGQINHPAQYFNNDENMARHADLLMLTHGWRRYHVKEALQGNLQNPRIKPEISHSFSGVLKGRTGRPYKKGRVKMSAVGYDFSEVVETDDKGRYRFDNFEFPDSTACFFLAYTNKKTEDIEICPDAITYPAINMPRIYLDNTIINRKNSTYFMEYVFKAEIKYIQENGKRMNYLPEVMVKAVKKKKNHKRYDNNIMIAPDEWISSEEIKEMPPFTFEELFRRIPGVSDVTEYGVKARGRDARLVLNRRVIDYKDLGILVNVIDIAQVDLYVGEGITLTWGTPPLPTIVLTTWPPGETPFNVTKLENKKLVLPLGYQKPVEFYSPKYDTLKTLNASEPDLRSTIYWKPDVITNNNNASVEFYTADSPTTYSVIIEGVSNDGRLIYCRKGAIINVIK